MRSKIIRKMGMGGLVLCCLVLVFFQAAQADKLDVRINEENHSFQVVHEDTDPFYRAFHGFQSKPLSTQVEAIDYLNFQLSSWPEMKLLGSPASVGMKTLVIEDFMIVTGLQIPATYNPITGQIKEIHTALSYVGTDWNQVFLPPESTLVLVKLNAQPASSPGCMDFRTYRWTIAYPYLPATEAWYFPKREALGNYPTADTGCLTSGWLYFYLPTLVVEPEQVWIMVEAHLPGRPTMAIWTLRQQP